MSLGGITPGTVPEEPSDFMPQIEEDGTLVFGPTKAEKEAEAKRIAEEEARKAEEERLRKEEEERKAKEEAMKNLDDREKRILALRFYDGRTQMEVASEVGISQAQVSRLEKNAISQIRKAIAVQ